MAQSPNLNGQFDFSPGKGLEPGDDLTRLVNILFYAKGGIVALAGGGAAGTQLQAAINNVDTTATNNDSVVMPQAASIGTPCLVNNNGAATLAVFGQGADTILASGSVGAVGAASVTQLTGVARQYVCVAVGLWKQIG